MMVKIYTLHLILYILSRPFFHFLRVFLNFFMDSFFHFDCSGVLYTLTLGFMPKVSLTVETVAYNISFTSIIGSYCSVLFFIVLRALFAIFEADLAYLFNFGYFINVCFFHSFQNSQGIFFHW